MHWSEESALPPVSQWPAFIEDRDVDDDDVSLLTLMTSSYQQKRQQQQQQPTQQPMQQPKGLAWSSDVCYQSTIPRVTNGLTPPHDSSTVDAAAAAAADQMFFWSWRMSTMLIVLFLVTSALLYSAYPRHALLIFVSGVICLYLLRQIGV
jgi:hypothetical protein